MPRVEDKLAGQQLGDPVQHVLDGKDLFWILEDVSVPDQRFASRLEPQGSLSVFSLANEISCQGSPLHSYSTPILNWKALLCGRNVNNYTFLKGRVNDTKNSWPGALPPCRPKMTHLCCCKSLPFSSSFFQSQIALDLPLNSVVDVTIPSSPFILPLPLLFFLSSFHCRYLRRPNHPNRPLHLNILFSCKIQIYL